MTEGMKRLVVDLRAKGEAHAAQIIELQDKTIQSNRLAIADLQESVRLLKQIDTVKDEHIALLRAQLKLVEN